MCIDSAVDNHNYHKPVNMWPCHNQGGNQVPTLIDCLISFWLSQYVSYYIQSYRELISEKRLLLTLKCYTCYWYSYDYLDCQILFLIDVFFLYYVCYFHWILGKSAVRKIYLWASIVSIFKVFSMIVFISFRLKKFLTKLVATTLSKANTPLI